MHVWQMPGGWAAWSYFPKTGQLRNQYDPLARLGYPLCLSACPSLEQPAILV